MDNVCGTFQPLKSDEPLIPVSFCQVFLGFQTLPTPAALCAVGPRTAGAQPVCPLQVGPRERAHISPSSWLIKTFSCSSPPPLPLPASRGCSHHADHTNQALIYSIYTILLSPLWLRGIRGLPLPPLPSVQPASC